MEASDFRLIMLVTGEEGTMSGKPLISLQQVEQIVDMTNATERNYQITQSYHDFSKALATALGDQTNANWSTFACWASKTAGESIRSEELPKVVKELFAVERKIHHRVGWLFSALYRITGTDLNPVDDAARAAAEVSRQVGDGNRKVYAELGPVFARFIAALEQPGDRVEDALAEFTRPLRPGATEEDGQELLHKAFTHYDEARRTADEKAKAELMLLGNCLIGLHEQTRLQPNIKGAVDAPVKGLLADGIAEQWPARVAFALFGFVGINHKRLLGVADSEWEKLVTRYAMDLSLPGGNEIALGGDEIKWPTKVPESLRDLKNPELIGLLQRFDDNIQVLRSKGADNWTDLNDRMGYIVELFRSQQQDQALFGPPFPGGPPSTGAGPS